MEDNYDLTDLIPKTKKRKNSRKKGNTFENKVAKILNEAFGTKDFCRTPGSGAFATTHTLPEHLKIHGDLITPLDFPYVFECKKGYNAVNVGSLFNYRSDFWKFIKQAKKDAEWAKKEFAVVFQQDRKNILVIIDTQIHTTDDYNVLIINKSRREKYFVYKIEDWLDLVKTIVPS